MTEHEPELKRQERVVDQTLSMHAALRDRYRAQGQAFTLAVLLASVFGAGFAFAGEDVTVTLAGVSARRSTWVGAVMLLTFALALVDLVTDRRAASRDHASAVERLASLKAEYRRARHQEPNESAAALLTVRYEEAMRASPMIPERHFNRLKSAHLLKVEVSRLLSENPGLTPRSARRRVKGCASQEERTR